MNFSKIPAFLPRALLATATVVLGTILLEPIALFVAGVIGRARSSYDAQRSPSRWGWITLRTPYNGRCKVPGLFTMNEEGIGIIGITPHGLAAAQFWRPIEDVVQVDLIGDQDEEGIRAVQLGAELCYRTAAKTEPAEPSASTSAPSTSNGAVKVEPGQRAEA